MPEAAISPSVRNQSKSIDRLAKENFPLVLSIVSEVKLRAI